MSINYVKHNGGANEELMAEIVAVFFATGIAALIYGVIGFYIRTALQLEYWDVTSVLFDTTYGQMVQNVLLGILASLLAGTIMAIAMAAQFIHFLLAESSSSLPTS